MVKVNLSRPIITFDRRPVALSQDDPTPATVRDIMVMCLNYYVNNKGPKVIQAMRLGFAIHDSDQTEMEIDGKDVDLLKEAALSEKINIPIISLGPLLEELGVKED